MKTKFIYAKVFTILFLLISFTACGGSNEVNCTANWVLEIEDELNALLQTSQEFNTNPTPASCEVYKSSLRDYIEALVNIDGSCIGDLNRQEYQASIAEARADIEEIDCSDI